MAKAREIELADGTRIPILYEDRSVLAIDKPPGWMLAPTSWDRTERNLQRALESSVAAGDFWARSRNLKYSRFVHRLDAETSGVLLLAKSVGTLKAFQRLFETRRMKKVYLAVVQGSTAPPTAPLPPTRQARQTKAGNQSQSATVPPPRARP